MKTIATGNVVLVTYSSAAFSRDGFRGITERPEVRRVAIREDDVQKWR